MTHVLVCGPDRTLVELVAWNLAQTRFTVQSQVWNPCGDVAPGVASTEDIVVADFGDHDPPCWAGAAHLRLIAPSVPLLLLSYGWPSAARLRPLEPCVHVRKLPIIQEILAAADRLATDRRRSA
ncbi:MAG: hypothetical protein M3336_14345 [Chloroflexota bacterium]|nr:hypothetical protein [Chloroflexota bacterium]